MPERILSTAIDPRRQPKKRETPAPFPLLRAVPAQTQDHYRLYGRIVLHIL